MSVITAQGLQIGSLRWPDRWWPHVYFDRVSHPVAFWSAAVIWAIACLWLLYASVAEIIYTIRTSKQRSHLTRR